MRLRAKLKAKARAKAEVWTKDGARLGLWPRVKPRRRLQSLVLTID